MASDKRPELVTVDSRVGDAGAEGVSAPGSAAARETGSGRYLPVLVWALGLALAVMAMLFAAQIQRSSQLAAQVEHLGAELEGARAQISAYEHHLGEVRSRLGGLSGQLDALTALVEAGPGAAEDRPEE